MSYIINRTDGSILTEVVDGTIDQTSTDITLIGKNSSSFGEFLNENMVKLLENFANTNQPQNPILGQLWYDTSEGRLKVYDGTGFKVSGGTILSPVVPSSISQGDLWIDSRRRQLYFNDGLSTMLVGPVYTEDQGLSGFQTTTILDTNGISRNVVSLYVAKTLIGIFSKDAFTPATAIAGFSGTIEVGFNVGTHSGIKFHVPVESASALIDSYMNLRTAEDFLYSTDNSATTGTITIQNEKPLILGANSENEIRIDSLAFELNANRADQNVKINVLHNGQLLPSIFVNTTNQYVGIFTNAPTATLDVNGDAVIQGSLTVKGTLTSINTTNLEIKDKLIELSKVDVPLNDTANGGGIRVLGGVEGDKDFKWDLSSLSWNSSESINLASAKSYKINGFEVLSYTSLGSSVESAPGLSSIGTLLNLQVDNININDNTISFQNIAQTNGDIYLKPKGTGSVDVVSSRITSLSDPIADTDAVNFYKLKQQIQEKPLAISLDITGLSNSDIATVYLNKIFPPAELTLSSPVCRVVCTDTSTSIVSIREFSLLSGVWTYQLTL
jgi:hypothetical protein